jgi:hypothetical protein
MLSFAAVLAATAMGSMILFAPASAQNPAGEATLPIEGSVTTSDNRTYALDGAFKVEVADITAGEFILVGAFTGAVHGATTSMTEYEMILPVLGAGPGGSCEMLYVDPTNLFTDALKMRPESNDVVVHLSRDSASDELIGSLCHLARVVHDAGAGSIDEAIFAVNDLLR